MVANARSSRIKGDPVPDETRMARHYGLGLGYQRALTMIQR